MLRRRWPTRALLGLALLVVASVRAEEPRTARQFYERALVHEREKRYAEALADLGRAVTLDPQFADAYFSRSGLYVHHKKDYGLAVADLSRILEITPRDFSARFNRALYYESLRAYDQALADYSHILDRDTDFSRNGNGEDHSRARAYHYRGRVYQWHKRDHVRAVADYTAALRLDPQIEMVHYRRGQAHQAMARYAQAAADFATALKRDPGYPNLLCSWAWQLATCPDPKFRDGRKALALARQANEKLRGAVAWHADVLAAAHAENAQFGEAVKWQKKALELLGVKEAGQREAMQARLKLYEAGKPFRMPASQ